MSVKRLLVVYYEILSGAFSGGSINGFESVMFQKKWSEQKSRVNGTNLFPNKKLM